MFAVYNVLFQLLAVRLSPKLLQDRGVGRDEVLGTLPWRIRDLLMPVWLNNRYVWSSLLLLALLATIAWAYKRRIDRNMDTSGRLAT